LNSLRQNQDRAKIVYVRQGRAGHDLAADPAEKAVRFVGAQCVCARHPDGGGEALHVWFRAGAGQFGGAINAVGIACQNVDARVAIEDASRCQNIFCIWPTETLPAACDGAFSTHKSRIGWAGVSATSAAAVNDCAGASRARSHGAFGYYGSRQAWPTMCVSNHRTQREDIDGFLADVLQIV